MLGEAHRVMVRSAAHGGLGMSVLPLKQKMNEPGADLVISLRLNALELDQQQLHEQV